MAETIAVDFRRKGEALKTVPRSELLAAIFENADDALEALALDGEVLAWNPGAERLFGWTAAEAVGAMTPLLTPNGEPSEFSRAVERLRKGERAVRFEVETRHKAGHLVRVATTFAPIFTRGELAAVAVVMRDVTEHTRVQEALTRANTARALLASIVESTHDAVFSRDQNGKILSWNRGAEELYGYRAEEIIGENWTRLIPPEELQARLNLSRKVTPERPLVDAHHVNVRKDGKRIHVSITVSPLRGPGGEELGASVIARDLSDRLKAEQTSHALATIVGSSIDAILMLSPDGKISSWSTGAEALFGYSAHDVIGQSAFTLVAAERVEPAQEIYRRVAEGDPLFDYRTALKRADGSMVEVMANFAPVLGPDGKVTAVSVVVRDLTEQKKAEAALRQKEDQLRAAQKLEAVGSLAGGVAHDFNNLLSVILSSSTLALRKLPPGDPLATELQQIEAAAERAATLTRQLLAFSRRAMLQPKVIDLAEVVRELAPMLRRLIGEDIELVLLTPPGLPPVMADRGQIGQVLVNLVVNARDAMPTGGKLTVEVAHKDLDESFAATHLGVKPGPHLMLAVTDTGAGMDAETKAHIFEPFFTTKGERGTGLGLATVFGIVKQSGGSIWVYSEPGKGSCFKIYLPRSELPLQPAASGPEATGVEGSETVLLVEDEPQVRAVVRTVLADAGYHVLEAEGPGDALILSEQHPARIHLLLTDVVMPRLSGRQLAERLLKTRPELRVLYMSGYTDHAIVHHGVLDSDLEFLEKPIRPDALLRKVRSVIDARR